MATFLTQAQSSDAYPSDETYNYERRRALAAAASIAAICSTRQVVRYGEDDEWVVYHFRRCPITGCRYPATEQSTRLIVDPDNCIRYLSRTNPGFGLAQLIQALRSRGDDLTTYENYLAYLQQEEIDAACSDMGSG